ncbi:hypothetical protein J2766_001064 [Agrobacterium tumefaciens]|nr:hypothetical protein [Agrobacterium tumefaciens]
MFETSHEQRLIDEYCGDNDLLKTLEREYHRGDEYALIRGKRGSKSLETKVWFIRKNDLPTMQEGPFENGPPVISEESACT